MSTYQEGQLGGVLMRGRHLVNSWAKTQVSIAMSSAEAELYSSIKATSECMGALSVMKDLGKKYKGVVLGDASAALGIIKKQGLGKLRHLDTGFLWIQQVAADKAMEFSKASGTNNPSDVLTN